MKKHYAMVKYNPKHTKEYAFFTIYPDFKKGDKVIVRDKNGVSLCEFSKYVTFDKWANNWIVQRMCPSDADKRISSFKEGINDG